MRLAHQMAIESDKVRADCIEAQEFPDLAQFYDVMAVPRTVANERLILEGNVPEPDFLAFVLEAAKEVGGASAATASGYVPGDE